MICRECGVEVEPESVYCHKCGARIDLRSGDDGADNSEANETDRSPSEPSPAQRFAAARPNADDDAELEIWSGGYSPKAMVGAWIGAGVVTVAGLVLAVFIGYWLWIIGAVLVMWAALGIRLAYKRFSISYRLTNQRFFHELGILSRTTDRIEVIDMDDITCTQGLIERMLNVGTVKVTSSDRTHPEIYLVGIDDVKNVAQLLDNARRKERMRRGLHIESI